MTEVLFEFDEHNYLDCQTAFRGPGNQEYYRGDYSIEAGTDINVRADRKAVGSCSIIRLTSKNRLLFRRSWSHIRQDATDVTVLWFVKSGRLCVSHQSGYSVAEPGDFVITKSMTPFVITNEVDDKSLHEVLHVIIPTHTLRRYIPHEVSTGFTASAKGRELAIVEHILMDVFDDDDELSGNIAELLVDSALSVLSHALRDLDPASPSRQTISDRRLHEVLRFIDVHLSDPQLSIAMVAEGCGISSRYMSYLLQLHGVPFSTLVWEKRLKMASNWLLSSKPENISISEIAYNVGFKSTAHFSRMFKREFKVSPREYRSACKPEKIVPCEAAVAPDMPPAWDRPPTARLVVDRLISRAVG